MSRIIIKNLPPSGVSENEIKKHFSDIDHVTDIKLKYNDLGAFRRFAFVGFKSPNAAESAIEKLNNTFIKNNKIALELCKSIRDIKPEKVGTNKKLQLDRCPTSPESMKNNSRSNKLKSKFKKIQDGDIFEEVKDDEEFKEFLSLQRNLGDKSKSKQIWSDDIQMEVNGTASIDNPLEDTELKDTESKQNDDLKPRKKHKRSRGKKKSIKSAPKELFVHTAKFSGYPENARRKDIKDFFKPLEIISVRLNKRDGVCYVSFKDDSDLRFALRKNLQFWGTNRIKMWRHNVKESRVFKEIVKEKVKQKVEAHKKYEATLAETEPLEESGRLFVRNLNYTCAQEDLEKVFSQYGELTEVHFPIDKNTSLPKGYAYVEFMFPKDAKTAYENLNGTIFQGRNFHLIPSKPKPAPRNIEGNFSNQYDANSTFKRDKLNQQKQSAPKGGNWNILFLGQNALANVVSDMKGMEKSRLLTHQTHKDPIAVRMALGDASVVSDMRKFLVSNGIELDSFDNPQAPRSKTVIIVKNLPGNIDKSELKGLFEEHGRVAQVIVPPNCLTAIVEMEEAVEAKLAFKKLAYMKFKDSVLYLEWAPINVFREKSLEEQERVDLKQIEELQTGSKILVKNVPFEATPHELKKIFASFGELNFVRIPKKIDGQHRGFGFVDFLTREDALRAFRSLCHSTHLYGRKLVLQWAKSDESSSSAKSSSKEVKNNEDEQVHNSSSLCDGYEEN